jgi:hypothetical protein
MRYLPSVSGSLFLALTLAGCSDGGTTTTGASGSTGAGGAGGAGGGASTSSGDTTTSSTGGSATSSSSASTGTGGPASDITGTIIDTYINKGSDTAVPNLAGTPVALVPSGNTFTTITGTVDPDGSFKIPNVPAGTVYVGLQSAGSTDTFIVTDQRKLDLGYFYAGRQDVKPITTSPTDLVLDLTGLAPWGDLDTLEIYSQGAASGGDLLVAAMTVPAAGDTVLTALSTDAAALFVPNQIEAAKGDKTYFTQLVSLTSGTFPYSSIGKSFAPAAFSLLDGATTPVTGAFTDVTPKTATLDWKRSLFAGLASAVNPTAAVTTCSIYLFAEPGGPTRSTNSYVPTILYGNDPGLDDVSLKLDYGNPFPADWGAQAFIYADFSVPYLVPGTATMKHAHTTIDLSGTATDVAAGVVKPIISPPSALKVGGKDAFAVNTGVGLTPVLSWSAPTLGTSVLYQVNVRLIDEAVSAGHFAGRFITQGTSVTLPPGMLASGSSYFVRITAQTAGSVTTPFKPATTGGTATAISGVFTP